jgi:copper chaperone CopZ
MTCSSCEAKVKSALLTLENVTNVTVSKDTETATITMDKHIALPKLQHVLDTKYQISAIHHSEVENKLSHGLETYKPILLIFLHYQ